MFEEDSKTYKIFISNLGQMDKEYSTFLGKLSASYDFNWENVEVLEKTTENDLYNQIKPVDVVIILSGLYSKDQKLIEKQINVARKLEKPIIVIRPYGMENVPPNVEDVANDVVGWNTPCIVESIRENSL